MKSHSRFLALGFACLSVVMAAPGCTGPSTRDRVAITEAAYTPERDLPKDRIDALRQVLGDVGAQLDVQREAPRTDRATLPRGPLPPSLAMAQPPGQFELEDLAIAFLPVATARPAVLQEPLPRSVSIGEEIETGTSAVLATPNTNNSTRIFAK